MSYPPYGGYQPSVPTPPPPPAPAPARAHTTAGWSRSDLVFLLIVGLAGGFGGSALASLGTTMLASEKLATWYALPLWTAHVVFAGLVVRRPGAFLATALVSYLPRVLTLVAIAGLRGSSVAELLGRVALSSLLGSILIGLCLEAVGALLWRRRPTVGLDSLAGLAVLVAYLLYQVSWALLSGSASTGLPEFGLTLAIPVVTGYLLAGLLPAAAAAEVRRSRASRQAPRPADPQRAARWAEHPVAGPAPIEHPRATTGLILGIVGLIVVPVAPVALALGGQGLLESRAEPGRYQDTGRLRAGFILGIIGTAIMVLAFVAATVWLAAMLGQ